MFTRYASAISTSPLMTLGLIYIMQTLISLQPGVITDPTPTYPVDWVRLPPVEEPPKTREHKIDKKDLVETLLPPVTRFNNSAGDPIAVPLPTQEAPREKLPTTFSHGDGPLVTMFNVQPTYPIRAIQAELEGYVIVEFDVDANGRPVNIRVVESTHNIFINPAIKAAERIKFKARVVDGTPVSTTNVQKLYRFDLEDA